MQKIKTKIGEVFLVKVPKDACKLEITKNHLSDVELVYWNGENIDPSVTWVEEYVPGANYEILGRFWQVEDKKFKEFVDSARIKEAWLSDMSTVFLNYMYNNESCVIKYCQYANESFETLCESQGIEDSLNNYLIIKKIKK